MTQVKRRYDGEARRARAERLGETLLQAAQEQFLAQGYAATTIASVAHACGVSVESVYRRFPGKAALIRAVVERALQGEGPVPAETRSDAISSTDLVGLLRGWGRLSAEVAPRVAPLLLLIKSLRPTTQSSPTSPRSWTTVGAGACRTTRAGSPPRGTCPSPGR